MSATPGANTEIPKRDRRMVALQSVLLVGLIAALAFWLSREWQSVVNAFESLSPLALVGAVAAATAGVFASGMAWRAVLGALGQKSTVVPALVVYLVGQLGKFIPGGFWALLYQVALGVRRGFAKAPTGLAGILAAGMGLATGATVLGLGLARIDAPLPWLYPILGAIPIVVALVWPPFLNWIIHNGLRLLRRGHREITFSRVKIAEITVWAIASWFMAAAQSLGFLVVIFPSGLGVREAVLVAGLASLFSGTGTGTGTGTGAALTVALAARATSTLGDLTAAGIITLIETSQRAIAKKHSDRDLV
jgi:hypothetical protein